MPPTHSAAPTTVAATSFVPDFTAVFASSLATTSIPFLLLNTTLYILFTLLSLLVWPLTNFFPLSTILRLLITKKRH